MFKTGKMMTILIPGLAIAFVWVLFSASMVTGQAESFPKIEEKLVAISKEEKEILQKLFGLVQEIEEMERAEKELAEEIEAINWEMNSLAAAIASEEIAFEKNKEGLKQVLKSYQRRGPSSYLEIILDSDSLAAFLRRVNILMDLTRNTGELLDLLEASKDKLLAEKTKQAEKLALMKEKQEQLKESRNKKMQLKEEQEAYLVSLAEEREYYQTFLTGLQQMWDELKPTFSETMKEFSRVIEEGDLPAYALKTTFSFYNIKGTMDEKAFNDIMAGDPRLPEMVFHFSQGRVEMRMPEKNLVMAGTFVIPDGHTLKFEVKEGSFYGMPLESGSIEALFREGYPELDLKPLLGNSIVRSIEIHDGYLELLIEPVLF